MKLYKELTYKEVTALPVFALAYISWAGQSKVPAFILPYYNLKDGLGFVYGENAKDIKTEWLPFETYMEEWTVDVENGITVDTPDGVLHAFDGGGGEYPGIRIDLYRPNDPQPISLSMTEYIPGGEGIYGYDPIHPGRQTEEYDEVPLERIVDKDGKPIACKGEITNKSGHTVSAGLVSRAWPNEIADEDYHKRVFHIGYKEEAK